MVNRWVFKNQREGDKYSIVAEPKYPEMTDYVVNVVERLNKILVKAEEELIFSMLPNASLERLIEVAQKELGKRESTVGASTKSD